jgi:serine protease Do
METVTRLIERYNRQRTTLGFLAAAGDENGLQIVKLTSSGPAAHAGLQPGDRIVGIGSQPIRDALDYALALLETRPGEAVDLQVDREGAVKKVALTAGKPPQTQTLLTPAQRIWERIGIRAEPLRPQTTRMMNSRMRTAYKGGLQITGVRSGSPAGRQGIEAGDILLGIHGWQTASLSDLEMIVERPELQRSPEAKFYLVRRDQTLFGYLKLAQSDASGQR